jgi:hypothetical protein
VSLLLAKGSVYIFIQALEEDLLLFKIEKEKEKEMIMSLTQFVHFLEAE